MISLESSGFVMDEGFALEVPTFTLAHDVPNVKYSSCINVTSSDIPKSAYVFPSKIPLQFVPGVSTRSRSSSLFQKQSRLDGDKRPTRKDGKPFWFVPQPSTEHLKKMEETRNISCSILKYVKVLAHEYGVVITMCTPVSLDEIVTRNTTNVVVETFEVVHKKNPGQSQYNAELEDLSKKLKVVEALC